MLKNLTRFVFKTIAYLVLGLVILYTGMYAFRSEIRETRVEEFNALTEGVYEYEINNVLFRVPGGYLSPYHRFHPGKVRALWLEGSMPSLLPINNRANDSVDVSDPDRITIEIFNKIKAGSMTEFVPVSYDVRSRQITPLDWIRYENNMGFLYYKNLGNDAASRMRCDRLDRVPNPACHVTYYIDDQLEVKIDFRLNRQNDWEEIESKVKAKLNEFILDGGNDNKSTY
jgi:hypothetical protein